MTYHLAFDVIEAGYRTWWFPAIGLGAMFLALIGAGSDPVKAMMVIGFGSIWTIGVFIGSFGEYWALSSALRDGRFSVIEGRVTGFEPPALSGSGYEQFCVAGRCFRYSGNLVTNAFNNSSRDGGPIRDGLQVRVTHAGNKIIRLEVAGE